MADEMVYSKLGAAYKKADMDKVDAELHARLNALKAQGKNKNCAECGAAPTNWASVSLGVFVCTKCAQIHRALGAHVSKIKSCMGTYQWFPDELEAMEAKGNDWAERTYGVPPTKPALDWAMGGPLFLAARDKYEHGKYKGAARAVPVLHKAAPAARKVAAPAPAATEDSWEEDW